MVMWCVYLIENEGCTYVGMTNDPSNRLKKHNGILAGGAKYTTSKGPGWKYVLIVEGFETKINAMQFEWAMKHALPRNAHGKVNRVRKLVAVLSRERWTSNSPPSRSVHLIVRLMCDAEDRPGFLRLFDEIPTDCKVSII